MSADAYQALRGSYPERYVAWRTTVFTTMLPRLTRRTARCWCRMEAAVARFNTAKPLRRRLSRSTDEQLDGALSSVELERADLFTAFRGNARHRKRMAAMMTRFRIDRRQSSEAFRSELRDADSICANCPHVNRCVRLLEWDIGDAMARAFCPNAKLYDRIAIAAQAARATNEPL